MKPVQFKATLLKYANQGEKTGWTCIEIEVDIAEKLKPGNRIGFRVKGTIDKHPIKGVALLPIGGGRFVLPVNAAMRKGIAKGQGAMVSVTLQEDTAPFVFNKDFLACLADEPTANAFFKTLAGSHQRYFSKWIDDAKTEPTRTKRIALAVTALSYGKDYGTMLRTLKESR